MNQETTPSVPELFQHAQALHRAGRLDEAAELYLRIMQQQPRHAPAHHMMGLIAHQKAVNEQALQLIEHAIALDIRAPEPRHDLAVVLTALGRTDDSRATLERLVAIAPEFALGHYSLGTRLIEEKRWEEAAAALQTSVGLEDRHAEAWSNLSKCLLALGRHEESHAALERAVELNPDAPLLRTNLGNLQLLTGELELAKASHRRAVELDPDCADGHFNLAACLLIEGDFREGWKEYEWRFRSSGFTEGGIAPFAHLKTPVWDGKPMRTGTLLVHYEQGLGDTIQFLRYLKAVNERLKAEGGDAEVVLACQIVLAPLLGSAEGWDRLDEIRIGEPYAGHHDQRVALMSLPHLFATTLDAVPAEVPYLKADPRLVARWRERLGGARGLKVGLCWQGNPLHLLNRQRSMDPAFLAALAGVSGVTFYGLQKGEGVVLPRALIEAGCFVDLAPELDVDTGAFMDTAAVMTQLDLVITVDTAVPHLAGALARPCWVMLAAMPEWRWLLAREDSPWYPTMRLFRQSAPGDWGDVVARVEAELRRLVSE